MMQMVVIAITLSLLMPSVLLSQDIGVTRVSDDVIILHPSEVRSLPIIREVGGTMTAVRTDSGIVVFDSFVSLQAAETARDLIETNFPNLPIRYLINTHHHADHVRGNQCFRGACIVGHKNVERYMVEDHDRLVKKYGHYNEKLDTLRNVLGESKNRSDDEKKEIKEELAFWNEAKMFLETYIPTPPSLQICSNTILKLGGKSFEILFYGTAHTDNDLVVLDREDRLLIMGDLLCYRKCYVMGPQSDTKNWIALLDNLIDRKDEFDYVVPGHGGAAEDVNALIEQRSYLKDICDAVENARQKHLTLDKAKETMRLEQYDSYMMYDRIGLDIEAYWRQIEDGTNRTED